MKRQSRLILLALLFALPVVFGQSCSLSKAKFSTTSEVGFAVLRSDGNGQSYDGKLTFIDIESGFACQNVSAPRSVLRRDENSKWTLTENEREKCAATSEEVTDVPYESGQTHLVYRGRDYYQDGAAEWTNVSLKGHVTNFASSAAVDPNTPDANPGDGICANSQGLCSLRAAIEEAAAVPQQSYVISLGAGTYRLTSRLLVSGQSPIRLVGESASTTVLDGQGSVSMLMGIGGSTSTLRLEKLGFTNGFGDNGFAGSALTVINSMHVKDCRFFSNRLGGDAIVAGVNSNHVLIEDSIFDANDASAISIFGSTSFVLRRVRISNNAQYGVRVRNGTRNVRIYESSVFGNHIGIAFRKCYYGCGIYNSTVANNSMYGVSLSFNLGTEKMVIQHSTVVGNGADGGSNLYLASELPDPGFLYIQNSLFGREATAPNCLKLEPLENLSIVSEGSLVDDSSCQDLGWPQQTTALGLSGFQSLGGEQWGYIPNLSSPAVDTGVPGLCLPIDQINQSRPRERLGGGPRCDLGAIEL